MARNVSIRRLSISHHKVRREIVSRVITVICRADPKATWQAADKETTYPLKRHDDVFELENPI